MDGQNIWGAGILESLQWSEITYLAQHIPHQDPPQQPPSTGFNVLAVEGQALREGRQWRRISLAEVQLLVQGVETHGVGRWSLILKKFFRNAEGLTSRKLQDKWKNVVRIARKEVRKPRGDRIPPELYDKILELDEKAKAAKPRPVEIAHKSRKATS